MVRLTAAHMAGNFLLKKKKRRTSIADQSVDVDPI